jgi:hypothetical protein
VPAALIGLIALLLLPGSALATKLLPLHSGQLTVLLGDSGQWQPQTGTPLTLTLLAGPPRSRRAAGLTAYVALQPTSRACPASPAAEHAPVLDIGTIYSSSTLVGAGNALAPNGGASPGVHAVAVGGIVIGGSTHAITACTWLDTKPKKRAPAATQKIPLLNGLFAASVWASAGAGGTVSGYTLDAQSVGTAFSYSLSSVLCGATTTSQQGRFTAGQEASYQVSISSIDCPTDGSTFTFSGPGGASLGSIPYTITDAHASPATIAHVGGCDLNGVDGLSLADARRYTAAVGCRVARVLTGPHSNTLPRGGVTGAQVDGGTAPVAPAGTSVDLVVNG